MAHAFRRLVHDPFVVVGTGVLGLSLAVYFLPGIDAAAREAFALDIVDLLFLVPLTAALLGTARSTPHPEERWFWRILGAGFACWTAVKILEITVPYAEWDLTHALVDDIGYQAFYGLVLMAMFTYPHRPAGWSRGDIRYWMEAIGTVLFAGGLLTYFVLVPAALDRTVYDSLAPSMMLYVTIDVALVLVVARHLRRAPDLRWRVIYGLLAVGLTTMLVGDVVETLMLMDMLPWIEAGHPIDIL